MIEEIIGPLQRVLQRGNAAWVTSLWDRSRFGGVPPDDRPEAFRRLLDEDESVVYDLLFRGAPASEAKARRILGDACVGHFLEHGLLERAGETVRTTGLLFRPRLGHCLLTGEFQSQDTLPRTVVHLGVDSIIFSEMIAYLPRVRRAVDLCAGSGIIALSLAGIAEEVVAVELVPEVAEVARINVALAGLSDRVEVREGDLYEAVGGERFDLIVSNPPFVPGTADFHGDRVGAGGNDGLAIVRAIWNAAPDFLTASGRLYMIAGMLGNEEGPFAEEEMAQLAEDRGWRVQFLDLQEAQPVNRLWVPRVVTEPHERRIRQIQQGAEQLGATHYFLGMIASTPSPDPGYLRLPLCPSRAEQMKRGVRELREIRR